MTEGEIADLKEKIKAAMVAHLTASVGYPECSNEDIMSQLKPMWAGLEEKGLKVEGMQWDAFVAIANHFFLMAEVDEILRL